MSSQPSEVPRDRMSKTVLSGAGTTGVNNVSPPQTSSFLLNFPALFLLFELHVLLALMVWLPAGKPASSIGNEQKHLLMVSERPSLCPVPKLS